MWIFTLIVIALWALFALVLPTTNFNSDPLLQLTFEKSIFPFHNAILFGYTIGISGQGCHTFMSHVVYDPDIAYTLSNIPEWSGWAKCYLGVAVFTLLYLVVTNLFLRKSKGIFLRSVLSSLVVFLVFYWFGHFFRILYSNFLLNLLAIALGLGEAILLAMYPISAILFLLPTSSIAAMNRVREEKERNELRSRAAERATKAAAKAEQERADLDTPHSIHNMPSVITGPYGHTYRQISANAFSAEYISDHDSSTVTIHDSDIGIAGNSAMVDGGYYHW